MVLVHDRDALGILGLQEAERLLEWDVRSDREVRRLGDRAKLRLLRVEAVRDHLANERLPRHDADEALVLGDVDGTNLRPLEQLTRSLRGRVAGQLPGIRDHRITNGVHGRDCRP
jgi:hypothetical protein